MALNDVGHVTVLVGNHDGNNGATVVGNGYFIAQTILQDV